MGVALVSVLRLAIPCDVIERKKSAALWAAAVRFLRCSWTRDLFLPLPSAAEFLSEIQPDFDTDRPLRFRCVDGLLSLA
jgi:hypothetical protein